MLNHTLGFICHLAHYHNPKQISLQILITQIYAVNFQLVGLIFTDETHWNPNPDSIFQYFRKLTRYTLLMNLTSDWRLIDMINVIVLIVIFTSFFAQILLTCTFYYFPKLDLQTGTIGLLFKSLYLYLLYIRYIAFIPIVALNVHELTCNPDSCFKTAMPFISLLGLAIYIVQNLISVYFFRVYQVLPITILQQRYSILTILILFLKVLTVILFSQSNSTFLEYIRFIALFLVILFKMIEAYYLNPYNIKINQASFEVNTVTLAICVILFLSQIQAISFETLFLSLLLAIPFVKSFSLQLYTRRALQLENQTKLQSDTSIGFLVCSMYEFHQTIKASKREHADFFFFCKLVDSHTAICKYKCQRKWIMTKQSINAYILCILQDYLKEAKLKIHLESESVQLLYINYLYQICRRPLLAYVELKKYEISTFSKSYFFTYMKHEINSILEKQIGKSQQKAENYARDQQRRSLEIDQISKTIIFEQQYIPQLIQILNDKIGFWQAQIKGFNSIYDLQALAVCLSEKIQQLQNELASWVDIEQEDHLGTSRNVLELKLASVYYSSVLNDYYICNQCEQIIAEIFSVEHTLSTELVTNLTLVEDKVALVMVSMVKNRGHIINQDKRALAQYFDYEDREFEQIQSLNQLMPPFISTIHDQLLANYLLKAKSKLFENYCPVFSSDKLGFLVAQQLKIDNNFLISDDYVLMGCLSRIKQSSEHIIFGEDGRIWGCTQGFYSDYVGHEEKMTYQRFTSGAYIFMLIPNIIKVIESYKTQLMSTVNEAQVIEDTSILCGWQNLRDLTTQFQQSQFSQRTSLMDNKNFEEDFSVDESFQAYSNLTYQSGKQGKKTRNYESVMLFNKPYQSHVAAFMLQMQNDYPTNKYLARYSLQYSLIQTDKQMRSYFVIQLFDIRKKIFLNQTTSSQNNYKPIYDSNVFSIENNHNEYMDEETNIILSDPNIEEQEKIPQYDEGVSGLQQILKKFIKSAVNSEVRDYQVIESGRDSMSYGPQSQRANFINLNQKALQDETQKLDQDFNEIQQNLNSASQNVYRQEQLDMEDIEIEDSDQQKAHQNKDSNSQKNETSSKILKILKFNKAKQNNLNQHEEEEVEAMKSKSSRTSLTSGTSALHIVKKFQSITHLTQSLRILSFINFGLFLLLIILIIIHLAIISTTNAETISTIGDINGPYLFNRNYLEVISFSWSLVLNELEAIPISQFVKFQTFSDLTNTSEALYDELDEMYPSFLKVEEEGLLSTQEFTLLNGTKVKCEFTEYLALIKNSLSQVVQIVSLDEEQMDKFLDSQYIEQLLTLRYNLKDLYDMAAELIDSLNTLFLNRSQTRVLEMEIQVIAEVICIAFILGIQLFYWKNIENYCQQILLLTGRLQESDANELIARASFIKEILSTQSGKFGWKKQNYYALSYHPMNSLGLDQFYSQSKFLREFNLKAKRKNDTDEENKPQKLAKPGQKRNLNVVLNARIYKTQISLVFPSILIGFVFVMLSLLYLGGFLLFQTQSTDLIPSQTLTANYIRFSQQIDTIASSAIIIKTQPLLLEQTISKGILTRQQIDSFYTSDDIFRLLKELYESYSQDMSQIYEDITISKKIEQGDKDFLYALYESSFCELLSDEIPMCNYDQQGPDLFTSLFGIPDLMRDDNREYLKNGIIGVISSIDTLIKQYYYFELENQQFQDDLDLSRQEMNQRELRAAILQHFLDTNDGTNTFLSVIQDSTRKILVANLDALYLYFTLTGSTVIIVFSIIFITWIYRTNIRLIRTRMALINLPIDILTEQHTISMLKKLN